MLSKMLRRTVALAACVAIAVPALAVAAPGKRQPRNPVVSYVVGGQVVSADAAANTVVLTVKKVNRHGRLLRGTDVTFDLSTARVVVRDRNGDGQRNLADVAAGDRAAVHARMPKRLSAVPEGAVRAKHFVAKAPRPSGSGEGEQQEEPAS